MQVFLVRHGEAASVGGEKKLTPAGKEKVEQLASELEKKGVELDHIYHSGIYRAQETAEIIRDYLCPVMDIRLGTELLPNSDPNIWRKRLQAESGNIMLIGHMPYMSLLATKLGRNLSFNTASVAAFEGSGNSWKFLWQIG